MGRLFDVGQNNSLLIGQFYFGIKHNKYFRLVETLGAIAIVSQICCYWHSLIQTSVSFVTEEDTVLYGRQQRK